VANGEKRMRIVSRKIRFSTQGNGDIVNLTERVVRNLEETGVERGMVNIFVPGATAGITTMEYEPGLVEDFPAVIERLIPQDKGYLHDESHLDRNAHSHLRATLLGPSLTVPFENRKLLLGTWQQIIFVDFDNRPRKREVILQIIGE
jgi:secondary thiamine-phosphate synthase enzyme